MLFRLLVIAAVTLTVGLSGAASPSRASRDPGTLTPFGRGIYTTAGADYARIADLGFRTVIANPAKAALDEIRAYRLTAMIYLGGYDSSTCTFGWSDAIVSTRVTAVRDHPASVMYYIADEPHAAGCADVVRQIRGRAQLVKRLDPTASTAISEDRPSDVTALANTTDVMILSTYPCSHPNGCVLSKIDAAAATARAANVKHPWGAPQSFGDDYYRMPSPDELQTVIDRWRTDGAQGFFTYTWNCCGDPETLANHPELWDTWRHENGGLSAGKSEHCASE
jgi:hypothetical protein